MYRHLLVPLDGSALAVESVRQAVELARALGARITFFHAKSDYGASSVGALERVMSPAAFNDRLSGEARAILSKAEVVAREAGVAFGSVSSVSDRPHEAILQAAEAKGCDLIFMASHGRRGIRSLMLGSQTERVLQNTTIPVLVAAVESNLKDADLALPVAIIRDEHRSLAAVIHGMEFLVHQAREEGKPPSFDLVRAMLHYIREFPEKLHHPKENAYLFRKLRERTREFDETLDELERQHVEGASLLDDLDRTLAAYEQDPAQGLNAYAEAVRAFAEAQWTHMNLETKAIIPAAQKYLTPEDWAEIGKAFSANGDPRFAEDADDEYRQLFARILNLAPPGIIGGRAEVRT